MPKGGPRPGSGRPKGAKSKRTRAIAEKVLATGKSPLEVMTDTMRALWDLAADKTGKIVDIKAAKEACDIAQIAAPYMHPRLAAVENYVDATVKQSVINANPMTPEDWEKAYSQDDPATPTVQ